MSAPDATTSARSDQELALLAYDIAIDDLGIADPRAVKEIAALFAEARVAATAVFTARMERMERMERALKAVEYVYRGDTHKECSYCGHSGAHTASCLIGAVLADDATEKR